MKKVIKETAAGGSTGAGSIAAVPQRLGDDMRKRESLKGFLLRFYKGLNNKMNLHPVTKGMPVIKEYYDLNDVVSQLKGIEGSDEKHANTVTYGVEDDNKNIMKVTVKKDQAKDFEYRLAREMADAKDSNSTAATSKTSLAELLYNLKDEFNIVDVEFPKIPKDVIYNADKATKAPPAMEDDNIGNDDMGQGQGDEGDLENGDDFGDDSGMQSADMGDTGEQMGDMGDMDGGEEGMDDEDNMEEPDDESVEDFGSEDKGPATPESILQSVMDMLKADAEAKKAQADAAAEQARATQAEYAYKSAQATVAHETEFAQMEVEADAQKQKQKDAKRLADLAKSKVQKASAFQEHSMLSEVLGQMINEVDEFDSIQSINRERVELKKRYLPNPGDTPKMATFKKQMLQAGNKELDDRLKAVQYRNIFNADQKQAQMAAAQNNAQNPNGPPSASQGMSAPAQNPNGNGGM